MRLFIGIPTRGVIYTKCISSVLAIMERQETQVCFTTHAPVHEARNHIVSLFLDSGYEELLMLDDDEVLPSGALGELRALNADVAIIDAPSKGTGKSNVFRNDNGTVAASGFGCALFRRTAFADMEQPWFDLLPRRRVERNNGSYIFPVIDDAPANPWGGEDVNFFLKLLDAGKTIAVHPTLVCTHLEAKELQKENRATEILAITPYTEITGSVL